MPKKKKGKKEWKKKEWKEKAPPPSSSGEAAPPLPVAAPPPPAPPLPTPEAASLEPMGGAGAPAAGCGDSPLPTLTRTDSLVAKSSSRHIPDEFVVRAFQFLDAASVAACRRVSQQWRTLGSSPFIWKQLCKAALGLHEVGQAAVLKQSLNDCSSWLAAYQRIPQVFSNGMYNHETSYVRQSWINDMFHPIDGELRVRYMRTFLFRPDGSLVYACIPGTVADVARLFKRRNHRQLHFGTYELHGMELHATFVTKAGASSCTHNWVFEFQAGMDGIINRRNLRCLRQIVQGIPTGTGVHDTDFGFVPVKGM